MLEFSREQKSFVKSHPCTFRTEFDSQSNSNQLRCLSVAQPPDTLIPIVGDFFHNIRSALDLLANQTALRNTTTLPAKLGFPICRSTDDFDAWIDTFGEAVGEDAVDFFESIQPYPELYEPHTSMLGMLGMLNIWDKHRELNELCTGVFDARCRVERTRDVEVRREWVKKQGALKPNTVVGRVVTRNTGPKPQVQVNFRVLATVVFDDRGPGRGRPVSYAMRQILWKMGLYLAEAGDILFGHPNLTLAQERE